MAYFEGTFNCGHKGRVYVSGHQKDRQRKADWKFSRICPECAAKERRENEEKVKEEYGLPDLIGTEKQVAWATEIRNNFYKRLLEEMNAGRPFKVNSLQITLEKERVFEIVDFLVERETTAKFWIDNRDRFTTWPQIKKIIYDTSLGMDEEIAEEVYSEEEIVSPENVPEESRKPGVVRIKKNAESVSAQYVKDDKLREIVKSLGFRFDYDKSEWVKEITRFTGSADDRSAELGNKLLLSGFTVSFPDTETKEKAVSGDYEPECHRWVAWNRKKRSFSVFWDRFDEDGDEMYRRGKTLPGAKYSSDLHGFYVPEEYADIIADFAGIMSCKISSAAQDAIEEYKTKEAGYKKENVQEHKNEKVSGEEKLHDVLAKDGIIDDLRDDIEE